MSQNPYNPYEQNPPDPNATPGTSYGSPPPPPGQSQGTAPGYGPYSPGATPPGQTPNYGSYYPYTPNPPTPRPAVNPDYNPYDQYAPTQAGQGAQPDCICGITMIVVSLLETLIMSSIHKRTHLVPAWVSKPISATLLLK